MLATIRDDTWNVLNMQKTSQIQKDGIIQTSPVAAIHRLKDWSHMVEGGHHPRNRPPNLGTTSVDFYHYPVTVWAYSTSQPNTEVPTPTGGSQFVSFICCFKT